jgi:endogenous inhibitor of DNA gyrase (YacG/DUF329 family)
MKKNDIWLVMSAGEKLKDKENCLKCGSIISNLKSRKGIADNFCSKGCQRLILLEWVIDNDEI